MENRPQLGLHTISVPAGSRHKKKLLGRGSSSGHGKTSSRGSKGQTSRAGRHFYLGFEGGQSPLIRRVAKRGFVSKFSKTYQVVNLDQISGLKAPTVTPQLLWEKGMVSSRNKLVKILGRGDVKAALNVKAHAFSRSAEEKIKKAGGTTEVVNAISAG
ncbi:MAG TPA: 50S ribosomal protein L15 [Candidatus Omnitrophota bacterium]|nr:50S ribosomal protein L15 [Candidatus Omnitrophota bacterium]HQJ15750.1 50S ribosomal protein L15 [Candidatus Omnitrophota bacterium]